MTREERLAEVLADYQDRLERGERPEPGDLLLEHPDMADDLHQGLAAMDLVDRLVGGSAELSGPVPERLGEYRILRQIGRGGMGVVYEAEQASMRRRVALKALFPRIGRNRRDVERFQREARAAGKAHHTNIVPVYGLERTGAVWFYAMELVEGTSLAGVLESMRRLGVLPGGPESEAMTTPVVTPPTGRADRGFFPQVAAMFADVADALQAAHEVGVIHRDVKPSNLILANDGRLKLIDFGLAWMRGEEGLVTASGERPGTPLYMSPELARGERVDARSDVYSLAATLHEVLTLSTPHRGTNAHDVVRGLLTRDVPPLRRRNPRVPKDLETIALKGLEKEAGRRYASAAAFARDLRAFAWGEGIRARPVGPIGRLWRRARRHPAVSSLVVMVLVLGVVGTELALKAGRHAERERELAYRLLSARAEVALARRGAGRPMDGLREPVTPAAELFGRAIALRPGRPEAWLGRALARRPDAADPDEARLADLDEARRRGLAARTYHLARAFILEQMDRRAEAREERERAAAAPSGGALDAFLEGRLLVLAGRDEEAIRRLDTAIGDAPDDSLHRYLALMARSLARRRTGDLEGALEDLSVLRALGGGDVATRVRIASVWRQLGRSDRAEAMFRPLLEGLTRGAGEEAWLELLGGLSTEDDADWLDTATERAVAAHPRSVEVLLHRDRSLRQQERTEESVDLCRRILAMDAECLRALSSLALGLISFGREEEALAVVVRGLTLSPREPALHNTRGLIRTNQGRLPEAEAAYRKALQADPANPLVLTNLASVLVLMERHSRGLALARQALELDATSANAHGCAGMALWGLGRFEESVAAYERAIELGARSPYHYGHYGMALADAGRPVEGLARMDEALAMAARLREEPGRPVDPGLSALRKEGGLIGVRVHRTKTLLALGRHQEGLEAARVCTKLAPERPEPWEHLGLALCNLERYERACEALERSIAIDPENHHAVCALGAALHELGRLDEARRYLERSIPLEPSCMTSWFRLGQVLARMGRHDRAIEAFERVLGANPEGAARTEVLGELGALLVETRRFAEALHLYDDATALSPDDAWIHFNRGVVLGLLGRHAEAVDAFERGMLHGPEQIDGGGERSNMRYNYACNLFHAGRVEEAVEHLRRVTAAAPSNALGHARHALFLGWLGRFEDADAALRRALESPRQPPEAWACVASYLLLSGRSGQARRVAQRLRVREPRGHLVLYLRALRAEDRLDDARLLAAASLEDAASLPERPLQRAWVAAVAGRPERARAELEQVERPWHPFAAYDRARVHALLGQVAAARRWLARAREAGVRRPAGAAPDPDLAGLGPR